MGVGPRYKDITGQRFNALVAIRLSHVDDRRRAVWEFACDCGRRTLAPATMVRCGHNKSCGCLLKYHQRIGAVTHGKTKTPAWNAWARMRARCRLPSMQRFDRYGGRGIAVCERWSKFENFFADMGEPPTGFTLERKDVDGNYEPSNCMWVSPDDQYSNTSRTRRVEFHGQMVPFRDLVRASGVDYGVSYSRVFTYGWRAERAFPTLKPESLHGKRPGIPLRHESPRSASRRQRKSAP